ncbi:hypothetical protein [Clostridium butyricum]|uniref:hypothetical protein n=1 Tax=Clostridium butyricum TaxID=1492 RepID=UPI0013D67646|nr:hypothetical protein [Clostridium butyricum]MCQ2016031.1 hypothetical protein [Clostridium butyricum]MCQ2020076.1 hypothetical protein [Clostridium butyricum]NFB72403.1 hypothetical protein [Clostridium butyricum]NFB92188.1 hypothetical protein [Clostridium butyricum]UTY54869.1 hypothetical protein HNS01_17895 [Clostridium butyricum]
MSVSSIIRDKLILNGGKAKVKLLRGDKYFNITLTNEGILVDNLYKEPLLEWKVFEKTIELLESKGGCAIKGDAMAYKLGDGNLVIDSIEGYIAKEVYNKEIGDSVFRRITPIVNILIWAELCENGRGKLTLK